ncbi:MAG TPA: hypothetical protein ENG87_02140 [Candidatus Pacearchaeota archaeon]|nr:hypothetical protein [Candidatus Pacearchaeota archaeon]
MKLKTLKDLEAENVNKTGEFGVSSYNLKQEAIKWVKERNLSHHQNCDAKICWLKFFNITKEDLE